MRLLITALAMLCMTLAAPMALAAESTVFCFYYPWYGTPEFDGEYRHWNHEVINADPPVSFSGEGTDIGANYVPLGGVYSSNDPVVVERQMQQMADARIDVVVSSWWGPGSFEDNATLLVMDKADEQGLKVCFHLEPYGDRNALSTKADIEYLVDSYGDHAAFYRDANRENRPVMFVYDSYLTPAEEWSAVLGANGPATIRGTQYDAVVIALWVDSHHDEFIRDGGFDGAYTYFAVDGFVFGSDTVRWPRMSEWCADNDLLFIPCVGPGYDDRRIRPWNTANRRWRSVQYYEQMLAAAVQCRPGAIGITSFNEWHEGTQIEPAEYFINEEDVYRVADHETLSDEGGLFLDMTADWSARYKGYLAGTRSIPKSALRMEWPPLDESVAYQKPVTVTPQCSPRYDALSGAQALTDGLRGSVNYRDGRWLGFEGTDVTAVIDLEELTEVSQVEVTFLHDPGAWIFLPSSVEVEVSLEGVGWHPVAGCEFTVHGPQSAGALNQDAQFTQAEVFGLYAGFFPVQARYVRVTVDAADTCPQWHDGAGDPAWLFMDEVVVE